MENRKLTPEELDQLARLDSPRLDMLAVWANKQLTCSHCKRCTLRCEVLKSAALDAGLVEEGYQRIMALAPEERIPAVQRLVQERPDVYQALRRCCFCGYCTAACRHHVLAADRMRDWRAPVHGSRPHAARRLQVGHGGQRVAHLQRVPCRVRHLLPGIRLAGPGGRKRSRPGGHRVLPWMLSGQLRSRPDAQGGRMAHAGGRCLGAVPTTAVEAPS